MKNQNPWNLFSCNSRSTADFWLSGRLIYEIPSATPEKGGKADGGKEKTTEEKLAEAERRAAEAKQETEAARARLGGFEVKEKAQQDLNARVDLWIDFMGRLKNNMPFFNTGDLQAALEKIDMEGALAMRVQAQSASANRRKRLHNQFRVEGALEDAVRQVIEAGHNVNWNKVIEGNQELTAVVHKIWNADQPTWEKKGLNEEFDRYGEYLNDSMLSDKYKEALGQLGNLAEIFSGTHSESKGDLLSIRRDITQYTTRYPRYRDVYDFACRLAEVFRKHGGTPEECNEVFTISAAGNKLAIAQAASNITRSKPEEVQAARRTISEIRKGNGPVAALVGRESALWALREPERKAGKTPPAAIAAAGGAAPPPAPAGAPAATPPAAPLPTLGAGTGPSGIRSDRGEGTKVAAPPASSTGSAEPKAPAAAPRQAPERKALTDARRVDIMKKYLDKTLKEKVSANGFKTVFGMELTGDAAKVAQAVRDVQEKLNAKLREKKQKPIKVDGILGPKTYAALVAAGNEALGRSGDIHAFLNGEEKQPKSVETLTAASTAVPAAAPTAALQAPKAPPSTAEKLPNPDRRNGRFIRDAVDGLKTGDVVYIVGDAIPAQAGYKQIERSDGTRLKMREGNLAPIDAKNREHLQAWDKFLAARFLKFREAATTAYLPQIDPARIYMYQGNPVYFETKSGDETVVRDHVGRKNTIKGEVKLTPADSTEQAQYVVARYKEEQMAHDVATAYQQAEAYVENQQQQQKRVAEKASAEAKPETPPATGG